MLLAQGWALGVEAVDLAAAGPEPGARLAQPALLAEVGVGDLWAMGLALALAVAPLAAILFPA